MVPFLPGARRLPGVTESRPLRADARRNRARVLAVADEVFAAEGLAVPIDEIARRAGLGVGTLYRHFPTKEALFEAVIVGRIEGLIGEAAARLDADDPVAALLSFLDVLAEGATTNHGLHDALTGAGVDLRVHLAGLAPELMDVLAELLRRAQATGGIRADVGPYDVRVLATAIPRLSEPGVSPAALRRVIFDGLRTTMNE
jgi:AcrR family transcriptional regulator